MKVNLGNDLYLKGRIGWKGLSKDEYLDNSDYRIINGYSLKDGYIDWDIAGYISQDRYDESPEIKLEKNDILISKDGTIGKVGIVRNLVSPTTVASGIFVLRNIIADRLDTEYLFQYLKSSNFKAFINAVKASGSTIIHLYQRDLAKLEIDVPQLPIQKAISNILFSLDSKIELNNRINAELEAMAKTLYDYWFVQFDFPDENGKPYKTSGGKMVWNEELKRDIPEGWEVGTIGDIAELVRGVTYGSDDIKSQSACEVIPILRATNISGNVIDLNNMVYVPKQNVSNTQLLNKYDILITMSSGSKEHIGKNGFFYYEREASFGAFCAKIVANAEYRFYLYSFTQSDFMFTTIKNECLGTNINNLNGSLVRAFKLIIPPNELIISFNVKVNQVYEKIGNNLKENQKLTELRDWLLPMLMNGQVKVS
jgi:type I restriction enzyme S subunit